MIAKPKGQNGLFNSQGEVDEPGPREYLRTGGERGQTVDERDKRKPNVKTSSPSSSTDPGFLFFGSDRSSSNGQTVVEVKTGSDPRDRSNGNFLTQFFSPEGTSCTMKDLDNPNKNDLESGKVDQFIDINCLEIFQFAHKCWNLSFPKKTTFFTFFYF